MTDHPLLIYAVGYFGWFSYGLWRFRRAPGDEIVQVALALVWPVTVSLYVLYLIGCWIEVANGTAFGVWWWGRRRIPKNRWDD